MSRRGKPRWGLTGVIAITNEELAASRVAVDRSNGSSNGLLFSDAQLATLIAHLRTQDEARIEKIRSQLNFIRGFYIKSLLYRNQTPTRADRNAALETLLEVIRAFRAAADGVAPIASWSFGQDGSTELGPFHIPMHLPRNLAKLADVASARQPGPGDPVASGVSPDYIGLAETAKALSEALGSLDHASEAQVLERLPWSTEYGSASFGEIVRVVARLEEAVQAALLEGKRRRGPDKPESLRQVVAWLAELYESCGLRFTHNPTANFEYASSPQSPAGRFVLEFFKMIAPKLSGTTVSGAMVEVIRSPQQRAPGRLEALAQTILMRARPPSCLVPQR